MAPVRERVSHLGDFTLGPRVLKITAWAVPIGAAGAVSALALAALIGLLTNLVFYQRSAPPGSPGRRSPPAVADSCWPPVAGGLAVGLMARFGSEKDPRPGMPEAIEAILVRGRPRLSPGCAAEARSSAGISIGTGGPFGAEGPFT